MFAALLTTVLALATLETPMLVGGNPYDDRPPEWLVRFDGEVGPCSGFLVAPAWIVTAAHCYRATETAQVGIAHRKEDSITYSVVEWLTHPQWDNFRSHDLALARIDPPAWGIQTLRIGDSSPEIGDWEGTTGGWGNYEWDPDNINIDIDEPRWKEVTSIVECEHFLDVNAICLKLEEASVCHGDSGSPLVGADGLAYGIAVRIEDGRCGLGTLTTYTDLTWEGHKDWIEDTVAGGIRANLEWPPLSPSGISIAGGWAFSTGGEVMPLVELWIDGEYAISMPCCSDRGDVQGVFPETTLLTGFAGTFNWGELLTSGEHTLSAMVEDTVGNRLVLEKNILID